MRKTWTERVGGVASRQVLTVRAGAEVCRQVGQLWPPVASVADEYSVAWDTAWGAVVFHGRPLVDDPGRVRGVRGLGVEEPEIEAIGGEEIGPPPGTTSCR